MAQQSLTIAVISPSQQIRDHFASAFEANPHLAALWTVANLTIRGQ
jgi:hypothetical protein